MQWIDGVIFILYMISMLSVGWYFMRRNKGVEDYYVGGRTMSSLHVGLSVTATDVGGGFSIGLGGLGFVMGLSGSWMLFTGLIGAWLSAVLLIPKLKRNKAFERAFTFPDLFKVHFGPNVALAAGIISAVGYAGFTASQILAGAKLASATFDGLSPTTALLIMGGITVGYTAMGGMKAVIYTDTIQWMVLTGGLLFVALPSAYFAVGGWSAIRASVPPEMLSLGNLTWVRAVNWAVTIVPIWFVGMTLYQRIYACRDEASAKRAWFFAGLLEWPLMAFTGVLLGLFARAAAERGLLLGGADATTIDPETGLPLLLRTVLPAGLMGITMSAYFSAILSTADSCLMAASGNLVTDIIGRFTGRWSDGRAFLRLSQGATLAIGVGALLLASSMTEVLGLMLYSYAFMVSGLFVPVMGALFIRRKSSTAALSAMISGGTTTVALTLLFDRLPLGLDANCYGILLSALVYAAVLLRDSKCTA